MLLKNNFTYDARVYKEAKTLVDAGYNVTVIAVKDDTTDELENRDGIYIKRVTVRDSHIKRAIKSLFKKHKQNINLGNNSQLKQNNLVNNKKIRLRFLRGLRWKILFEWSFFKAAIREKADIYHSHELLTLFHGYVASKINKAKLVYDAHELQSELVTAYAKRPKFEKFKWETIERIFIKKADRVITVSESIGKVFSERYKIKPPTILINCPPLINLEKTNRIRDFLRIESTKRVVVYQGNFTVDKGIDKFIDMALYLYNAVLVLIGDGPCRCIIEQKIKMNGLEEKVFLLGRIPLKYLSTYTVSADIGICFFSKSCLNSYYSLPNKLFDYLMVGLPVIASNFPDMKKVIEENYVGRTIDPGSPPEKIAGIINEILQNRDLYNQMSENARRITSTIYNWENESKKLINLYKSL